MLIGKTVENLSITYLGHSSFFIKGNYSLVTDPFSKIGFPFKCDKVDYCLSSHNHYDHNAIDKVSAKYFITSENNVSANELSLERIDSFHDECNGKKRGKNTVFKFEISNVKFCHLGDFGEGIDENLSSRLGVIDVLFVPVGGVYTINFASAIRLIQKVNPKIAIPMHYKTPRSRIDLDTVECFVENAKQFFELERTTNTFFINSLPDKTLIILPSSSHC